MPPRSRRTRDGESPLDSLRRILAGMLAPASIDRELRAKRRRILLGEPSLAPALVGNNIRIENALTAALERRLGVAARGLARAAAHRGRGHRGRAGLHRAPAERRLPAVSSATSTRPSTASRPACAEERRRAAGALRRTGVAEADRFEVAQCEAVAPLTSASAAALAARGASGTASSAPLARPPSSSRVSERARPSGSARARLARPARATQREHRRLVRDGAVVHRRARHASAAALMNAQPR